MSGKENEKEEMNGKEEKKEIPESIKLTEMEALKMENLHLKATMAQQNMRIAQAEFNRKSEDFGLELKDLRERYKLNDRYGFDVDKKILVLIPEDKIPKNG